MIIHRISAIRSLALITSGLTALSGFAGSAWAQAAEQVAQTGQDIIVTARKRNETLISVPVTVTAVGSAEIQRRALSGLDAIAKTVPGLTIGEQGGSAQGGTVSMRGITGPNINVLGDQAVSFNVDGVAIARSSVRQLGTFDLEQVEVLKGPQALFFGKNSPGGVISLRTADPTDTLKAKLTAGFEAEAEEFRAEGFISGPLTDSLGARVAVYYSKMRGWVENTYPKGYDISPRTWGPHHNEFDIRGTLKFDDGGPFNARLKVTAGRRKGSGSYVNAQNIHCQNGDKMNFDGLIAPGGSYDCKGNDKAFHPDLGSSFGQYNPRMAKGARLVSKQQLYSLEMNYDVAEQVKLTSVTGYYHADANNVDQYDYPINVLLLPSAGRFKTKEFSQEIRLASDYDLPFNFTVGGLYARTRTAVEQHTLFGTNPPATNLFGFPSPTEFNEYNFYQHGTAWSVFGQLSWKIAPTVELSGGGRYSYERKSLPLVEVDFTGNPTYGSASPNNSIKPISFKNFSPEVSLSWRPNSDLTIFGNYKQGFLSGGYNGSSDVLVPGQLVNRPDYGPEKVRGFEVGIKSNLMNNLRVNLYAFYYKALGLQVASYQQGFSTIRNAGKVNIKGVEGDFNWRTPVQGLELRGAFAYTRSIYAKYEAPCYTGQTQALGCTINLYGDPLPQTQDLAGTQVPNAPYWVINGGFNYETAMGSNLKLGLSGDVNFNTSYVTDSKNTPFSRSPKQALIDASVRVGAENDRWEVALVGRNLTNRFYWVDSQENFPSGSGTGGPAGTVSVVGDRTAVISRGRELWLRLSLSY